MRMCGFCYATQCRRRRPWKRSIVWKCNSDTLLHDRTCREVPLSSVMSSACLSTLWLRVRIPLRPWCFPLLLLAVYELMECLNQELFFHSRYGMVGQKMQDSCRNFAAVKLRTRSHPMVERCTYDLSLMGQQTTKVSRLTMRWTLKVSWQFYSMCWFKWWSLDFTRTYMYHWFTVCYYYYYELYWYTKYRIHIGRGRSINGPEDMYN
jgi:hypothetical protein